jgi:hypothetical protein
MQTLANEVSYRPTRQVVVRLYIRLPFTRSHCSNASSPIHCNLHIASERLLLYAALQLRGPNTERLWPFMLRRVSPFDSQWPVKSAVYDGIFNGVWVCLPKKPFCIGVANYNAVCVQSRIEVACMITVSWRALNNVSCERTATSATTFHTSFGQCAVLHTYNGN